jgi:hypothetical protein
MSHRKAEQTLYTRRKRALQATATGTLDSKGLYSRRKRALQATATGTLDSKGLYGQNETAIDLQSFTEPKLA